MATINVSDLTGAALDWAVANALGLTIRSKDSVAGDRTGFYAVGASYNYFWKDSQPERPVESYYWWSPSESWKDCGPLIDQHSAIFLSCMGQIRAEILGGVGMGENHKVAICRAIVAAKFGKTIDIPLELLHGYNN
jgi:hypothetical protein